MVVNRRDSVRVATLPDGFPNTYRVAQRDHVT